MEFAGPGDDGFALGGGEEVVAPEEDAFDGVVVVALLLGGIGGVAVVRDRRGS